MAAVVTVRMQIESHTIVFCFCKTNCCTCVLSFLTNSDAGQSQSCTCRCSPCFNWVPTSQNRATFIFGNRTFVHFVYIVFEQSLQGDPMIQKSLCTEKQFETFQICPITSRSHNMYFPCNFPWFVDDPMFMF